MAKLTQARFRSAVRRITAEALSSGERRLLLISGRESLEYGCTAVRVYCKLAKRKPTLLYSADTDPSGRIIGLEYAREKLGRLTDFEALSLDDSDLAMGGTWTLLLADLSKQFRANDLGRLVEVVEGGGLAILCIPPVEEWLSTLTPFERKLVSKPYTESDVKHFFKRRFLSKALQHRGVWLVDLEKKEIYGEPLKPTGRKPNPFTASLLGIPLTEDQFEAVEAIQNTLESREERCLILTADRGRGKSAVLGLGLAWYTGRLVESGIRRTIFVTAPEPSNVKTLMEFLCRGLESLNLGYETHERRGYTLGVEAGGVEIVYVQPLTAAKKKLSIKIVDEAAGIPVPLLVGILRRSRKTIFSSTVHGYEGAGRGFSVRFMKTLEASGVKVETVKLETPIRYPTGDPVERWLYDTLLLNAEPDQIEGEPTPGTVKYRVLTKEDLLNDENLLRSLYGIYVLAHYRNRPNDLAVLLDAPHHSARGLTFNGKIVVSLWIAEEGGLTFDSREEMVREAEASGHVIPSRIALHYDVVGFFSLKGLRVVRIATHPSFTGRGLGSQALRSLEAEAKGRGYFWVGAGFGASEELLRFWLKNGYIPVHLSPSVNPVSGEYSVIVVKPLNGEAYSYIAQANLEFRVRLLESLHDIYFRLEPSIARLLLSTGVKSLPVQLTPGQEARVRDYSRGVLSYEASSDAVKLLAKKHFLSESRARMKLDPTEEELLIAKLFKGEEWDRIRRTMKIDKPLDSMRRLISSMVEHYLP